MMGLSEVKKKYLNTIYNDPARGGSYMSPSKLVHTVKREAKYNISLKEIKVWIRGQESYTLNRDVNFRFPKSHVITAGINDIFESDLCDFRSIKKHNDNYSYLVGVICLFSRMLYVRPLKNKTSEEVIKAFKSIFKQIGSKCKSLRTDRGSEYISSKFQAYMKSEGIALYHSHGQSQANFIERAWRTIKRRIYRHMKQQRTQRYIDKLSDFVTGHNATYHSGILRRPIDINKNNEHEARYDQYVVREKRKPKNFASYVNKKAKFSVGDTCRIAMRQERITSDYVKKWSAEVYYIHKAFRRQGIPVYIISDEEKELLEGTFYESELQRVDLPPKSKLYEIEKIIDRKKVNNKDMVLVRWRHFNKKYDQWIDVKDLEGAIE